MKTKASASTRKNMKKQCLCRSCMIVLTHFLSLSYAASRSLCFRFCYLFFFFLICSLLCIRCNRKLIHGNIFFLLGDATHTHINHAMTFMIESQSMYGCTHANHCVFRTMALWHNTHTHKMVRNGRTEEEKRRQKTRVFAAGLCVLVCVRISRKFMFFSALLLP